MFDNTRVDNVVPIKIVQKRLSDLYSFSLFTRVYTFLKIFILPFKEFSENLPQRGFFVDIGTGIGYIANFIAIESEGRNVIGIDIDSKRIAIAKKTIRGRTNIDFVCGDIRQILNLDKIDVVTMADVLHHIPFKDHSDFLKCIYKRLKANGIFIIRETNKKRSIKYYLMNYLLEVLLYPFSEKCHFYTAMQLRELLEQTGFKVTKYVLSKPWFVYETVVYICKK